MNSSKHNNGTGQGNDAGFGADMDLPLHPVEIHERRAGTETDANVIEVAWKTDRKPAPWIGKTQALPEEVEAAWPSLGMPRKALTPRPGFVVPAIADKKPLSVMIITLFGLDTAKLQTAVRQIERHHRTARNFVPLFLTDNADTTIFRHFAYNYEYFPPNMYCAEDQQPLFEARFHQLWRKWKGGYLIDFSAPGFLAERVENLEVYIKRDEFADGRFDPRKKRPAPMRPAPTDIIALRAEYMSKKLDQVPDNFVLYRILGNDLPPRHESGQTLKNLRFILENEPPLERCEKRWVVNRVVDPEQEAAILALLEEFKQPSLRIPFLLEEYADVDWDLESFPQDAFFLSGRYGEMNEYDQLRAQAHSRRFKNGYVINNNGARNAALHDGQGRAKWVLPWDGNCFLTEAAWAEIVDGVTSQPYLKYFIVPMSRTLDNAELLDPEYRPEAEEEPQMLFRSDAQEDFDETFYYGRRPKVELFYRLGIPGKWDSWPDDVWDRPRAERSEDAGSSGRVGWVARLYSGQKELEVDKPTGLRSRGEARISAITQMLDRLDVKAAGLTYDPDNLVAYDEAQIRALAKAEEGSPEHRIQGRLLQEADIALQRGPYSVVAKTALPPSGDPHDYYNPAPYWWPNPATPNGMPFIFKDGERIPGTRLYEPESDSYDRTRLQRLFDDTTTLALAWVASDQDAYVTHAANLIRTWFIAEDSRMNPHLLYSQVRSQTAHDQGSKSGLIEMKDLYYFLDAVRLVERAGKLDDAEKAALRAWFAEYLEWLQTSEQGMAERVSPNNHGTCYDLQTASIAAYLGDADLLQSTFRTSRERILEQFTNDGQQPHEMKRTQTAHYCCFNLQGWINLANLAEACGDNLWYFEGENGRGLARVFGWLLPHLAQQKWPYQQIEPFDRGRFLPLFFAARDRLPLTGGVRLARANQVKPLFFAHDGIKPFWMLGKQPRKTAESKPWKELAGKIHRLEAPVFEICFGSGFVAQKAPDVRSLDKKLWGGFSAEARSELAAIRDDASLGHKDINRAARTLARWYFTAGDYAETLKNIDAMQQLGVAAERERSLLRSCCLDHLGQQEAAGQMIRHTLSYFPRDTSLCLAMANICSDLPEAETSAEERQGTYWVNRIFRQAGLSDLLAAEDEASGAPINLAVDYRAESQQTSDPRVTVILPVGPGAGVFASALTSLQNQSWRNLQILIADYSDMPEISQIASKHARSDARIEVLKLDPGLAEYGARNAALEHVDGTFVTVQKANELAHPIRIKAQIEALTSGTGLGTVTHHVEATADLHIIGGWFPEFAMCSVHDASMMLPTDTLREAGGWDAVADDPDAFLKWRLKKRSDKPSFQDIQPGIPLSLSIVEPDNREPTHLDFPYGKRRDELRRLIRISKSLEEVDDTAAETDPVPVPALLSDDTAQVERLDTVFVGDFSASAVSISEIKAHILGRIAEGKAMGLFHWPDYYTTWNDDLDESIAQLIDEGAIAQISAFQKVQAVEAVLCNPYIIHHPVDGVPDFEAKSVAVLSGPELTIAEFFDGHQRRMPTREEIEALFGCPGKWVSL
ncbi:glycosyltransferase [Rhodophyticola sp. CCM32]|uniref:alginate lyase family protein n=1 Tax=Rhodophyticola sp. CCM32 TaxID=2916397 RepID=UPI00107F3345|nr:alginate lyase family protein [Rhodophyticola sp. CCM32]QBY01811.1 glycosyltransferase [Rhodophyticola sp. CCM32]